MTGQLGDQLSLPGGLIWRKGGLKYLGVFLGNDTFLQKNWENVVDRVNGRLSKWRWLLPHMSYRGRVLVINNLVSSALWHRLTCVDPPVTLLSNIQRIPVDFFGDKLHWIPQSVLFLPREDGGQGLVHLASRGAAFRFQFFQRLLTGPQDLVWRSVSCCILQQLGHMGLDLSVSDGHKQAELFTSSTFLQECFFCMGSAEEREAAAG